MKPSEIRYRLMGGLIFLLSLAGLSLGMQLKSYLILMISSLMFLVGLAYVFLPEEYGSEAGDEPPGPQRRPPDGEEAPM